MLGFLEELLVARAVTWCRAAELHVAALHKLMYGLVLLLVPRVLLSLSECVFIHWAILRKRVPAAKLNPTVLQFVEELREPLSVAVWHYIPRTLPAYFTARSLKF